MALSLNTVWEVRTAGNDTNGGGFVTGASGTDYSQQDNKNTGGNDSSTTDAVSTSGSNTLTSATASFQPSIIGNIIYLQGGTGSLAASRYQVTSRPNGTTVTLDRNIGTTSTGVTMNVGGAVATLGILGSTTATILVDGNKIFIKAGTYTTNVSGNNVSNGFFNKANIVYIEGYQTTRGDLGTPPVIQASGITSFTLITMTGVSTIKNITLDGANLSSGRGIGTSGVGVVLYRCNFINFQNNGVNAVGGASTRLYYCSATGCSAAPAFNGGTYYNCVAYANSYIGFNFGNTVIGGCYNCLSYSNTGASTDGFQTANGSDCNLINCTAYGNGRDGFRLDSQLTLVINCIAESNTGIGFNLSVNPRGTLLFNCAGFSAGTNVALGTGNFVNNTGFVTGSGSFFTNAASGDFSLNATAGRGAALRGAGLPGLFPVGLTTSYLDVGAAQHQDAGGGGGGGSSESSAVF